MEERFKVIKVNRNNKAIRKRMIVIEIKDKSA